jgi:hypothetical protein
MADNAGIEGSAQQAEVLNQEYIYMTKIDNKCIFSFTLLD